MSEVDWATQAIMSSMKRSHRGIVAVNLVRVRRKDHRKIRWGKSTDQEITVTVH